MDCRGTTCIGSSRSWWVKFALRSGRRTASYGIHAFRACATTNDRPRSCERVEVAVREMQDVMRIGRRAVMISNPEKVIFPDDGITKGEMVEYYRRIAPHMLPHLRGRPIAMERYPDGIDQPGFFQKAAASYYPDWIRTVTVRKVGGTVRHVVCNNAATLVYIANLACVTPHIWLSRAPAVDYPDQLVFDLDPSGDSFEPVKTTAQAFKQLLDQLGVPAYLKTTGSRGLHVAVPLRPDARFEAVRAVAQQLAEVVVRQAPGERTLELRKQLRRGRV